MDDKELFQQKIQAQLDEWKAKLDQLKAQAVSASADMRLQLNEHIKELEGHIETGKTKFKEIQTSSGEAWESIREGMESAWESLKNAANEATTKFKAK